MVKRKLKMGDRVRLHGTIKEVTGTVNGEVIVVESNKELIGYAILLDRANYLRDMSLFVRTVFASSENLTLIEM
ncbi:MAG TPA: hypothetical protein VE135_15310 [Pyrinomonadaceae bacterium]|nr:hypothetical protein [Pyrinomonadaceae bacterium]